VTKASGTLSVKQHDSLGDLLDLFEPADLKLSPNHLATQWVTRLRRSVSLMKARLVLCLRVQGGSMACSVLRKSSFLDHDYQESPHYSVILCSRHRSTQPEPRCLRRYKAPSGLWGCQLPSSRCVNASRDLRIERGTALQHNHGGLSFRNVRRVIGHGRLLVVGLHKGAIIPGVVWREARGNRVRAVRERFCAARVVTHPGSLHIAEAT
jgi:hypothetical protein